MEEIMKQYAFYGWQTADIRDARGLTPRDYYDHLSQIWSAETCAPRMRDGWTKENKTLGQCSVTAFLMQDMYGGQVRGVALGDGNYHCFNVADGCVFDLTSEQFGNAKLDYENCPEQKREEHFAKTEKRLRYELLKARLRARLAVIRPMKEQDRQAVREMMRVFYASPAVLSNGSDLIFDADIDHCVGGCPYLEGFVFEEGNALLGYGMIAKSFSTEFGKPCVWIEDLYIREACRGAGLGSRFLEHVKRLCPDWVQRLEVEAENERAIEVYKKNGFDVLPYMEMKR